MTIYVDNANIPAKVGRHSSVWCHLITDNPDLEELHRFAERIGLRRSYFQDNRYGPNDPGRPHYDVTAPKRVQAVAAGAVEVDIREVRAINDCRRAAASGPSVGADT